MERLEKLQEQINYKFKDISYLRTALSHSSFINEKKLEYDACNERLEFLGDAILEAVISETLFTKYPKKKEGELSKMRAALVCEPALAYFAKKIELNKYIYLGAGEEKTGGRERASIISDCMEAVIGAIFLDGGLAAATYFIKNYIAYDLDNIKGFKDYKSELQEFLQSRGLVPKYHLVGESGPSHNKEFSCIVKVDGKVMGSGRAQSKKKAEQAAAGIALEKLQGK